MKMSKNDFLNATTISNLLPETFLHVKDPRFFLVKIFYMDIKNKIKKSHIIVKPKHFLLHLESKTQHFISYFLQSLRPLQKAIKNPIGFPKLFNLFNNF